MYDQANILFLNLDEDFVESLRSLIGQRKAKIHDLSLSNEERHKLDTKFMENIPDIVVVNLDRDDILNFGKIVREILAIALPLKPLVLGLTRHDEISLKQQAYNAGIDDCLTLPLQPRNLWMRLDVMIRNRHLQKQLDVATRKLSSLNVQLLEANRALEDMTITDELTGLHNMRYMTQYLKNQFLMLTRFQRPFAIIMIDLDRFKLVNDKNDHLTGSATIREVGKVIAEATRAVDVKARYGGDEYIVALPETDEEGAIHVAERIRNSVNKLIMPGRQGKNFSVTASLGVAIFNIERHRDYKDLVKDADRALYAAKSKGRNKVIFFNHNAPEDYSEQQSAIFTEIKKVENG